MIQAAYIDFQRNLFCLATTFYTKGVLVRIFKIDFIYELAKSGNSYLMTASTIYLSYAILA